jgi:predicted transcriptional regulator
MTFWRTVGLDISVTDTVICSMPMTGAQLRQHRKRLGLTQKQMAERLGLHWNSLARMERGEIGMRESTIKLIRLIAGASKKR